MFWRSWEFLATKQSNLPKKIFSSVMVLLVLLAAVTGRAATKDQQPDRAMLRMMDFLREMEMIKQMEILHDMHDLQALAGDQVKTPSHRNRRRRVRKKR